MRYSKMSQAQRRIVVDNTDNYPLKVIFRGKSGILSPHEIAFLIENGVDFAVDSAQFKSILANPPEEGDSSDLAIDNPVKRVTSQMPEKASKVSSKTVTGVVPAVTTALTAAGLWALAGRFRKRKEV